MVMKLPNLYSVAALSSVMLVLGLEGQVVVNITDCLKSGKQKKQLICMTELAAQDARGSTDRRVDCLLCWTSVTPRLHQDTYSPDTSCSSEILVDCISAT